MSIADKLNYLITTKGLLKDNINKINNVLDDNSTFRSYPQELFNGYLDILNNGTDTLWNNLEKVSQTGTEAVLENVETAPMKIVLNGNTSQDGTPTPDTPVEVKVVKGENVVSVSGKNLFDVSKLENASLNYPNAPTRLVMFLDKANQGTKMSVTNLDTTTYRFSVGFAKLGYASQSNTIVNESGWTTNSTYTITANNDGYPFLQISRLDNANVSASEVEDKFQLEYSDTASEYTPFSKTDYPINLGTLELCKIGTYKDYLFKRNGKWFKHSKIGKVVLDGSEENWFQSGNYFRIQISNSKSGTNCRSNYFVAGNQDNQFFVYVDNCLGFRYSVLNNILADWKTWLSTHNLIVYYVLATPTETEITNTTLISQLEAISKAKSVKDKTYITQTNEELPFILDVEAIKEYEVN